MAFPQSILDFKAELNLSGTWTDITSYVYQRNGAVQISRGRPDEATQTNPSQIGLELNNRDGRFSPRNPTGAYYGSIGRNTPVRASVPAQTSYLRLEGDTTSSVSTPDSVGLSITGDIEIQIDVFITGYSQEMTLAAKANDGTSNISWVLSILDGGVLAFDWSSNGSALNVAHSTVSVPVGRTAFKVTLAVASGTVTFYTAPTISGSWTQLGSTTVAGATSIFDSTASVTIGYDANFSALLPSMQGNVYGFKILSGIGGTVKAFADFTAQTAGVSSFVDAQSNTWTLNGTAEISNRNYRFHGEMSSWPQRWDPSGNDVWSPSQASGVLRRLGQGSPPSDSSMKRYVRTLTGSSIPLVYFPCEDGADSTQIASGIGGSPMTVNGSPNYASNSSFFCSNPIPALNGSTWLANVPVSSTTPTVNAMKFLLAIPSGGETNGSVIARMFTTGSIARFDLAYSTSSGGSFTLNGFDSSGNSLFANTFVAGINGDLIMVAVLLVKNGTGVDFDVQWMNQAVLNSTSAGGSTLASSSVGSIQRIVINPDGALTTTAMGHISVINANDLGNYSSPFDAFIGETAADRFSRICSEEGITSRIYGFPDMTQAMGAQLPATVVSLLQQCEDTDRGMMYEPRQVLGLGYRTRESLENQSVALTLSYTSADVGQDSGTSIEPADDDQYIRNDVTVSRINGSSSRETVTTGTLSTQPPPSGVGTYQFSVSVSCFLDKQTDNLAGWISYVGTVDQPRYPSLPFRLARSEISGSATKYYGLQSLDQGDYLAVSSPPVWLPPGSIKQIIAGTTENLGGYVYDIDLQCIPESPYEIGVVGSGSASDNRVDTDGSTLHTGVNSSATSLSIDTTTLTIDNRLWTTTAGDFPFDIYIGGEQMTVTNITGSSSPQTFTVTRSVNGVSKSHTAGEAVTVVKATIVALDDPY
jgi:hypothetical protein